MRSIICDASPLIFLAKLDELSLISQILGGEVIVLQIVVEEVSSVSADHLELIRLHQFFENCTVVDYINSDYPSRSLSESDRSVLNWAINHDAAWLVADERLLRRLALEQGLSVIGVFGLLLAAAKNQIRTKQEVKDLINDLVTLHQCHISVSLYQKLIQELENMTV